MNTVVKTVVKTVVIGHHYAMNTVFISKYAMIRMQYSQTPKTPMCYAYKSETPPPDKQDTPAARHIRDILKTY